MLPNQNQIASAMPTLPPANLLDIPPERMIDILSRLSSNDLWRLRMVNKHLREQVNAYLMETSSCIHSPLAWRIFLPNPRLLQDIRLLPTLSKAEQKNCLADLMNAFAQSRRLIETNIPNASQNRTLFLQQQNALHILTKKVHSDVCADADVETLFFFNKLGDTPNAILLMEWAQTVLSLQPRRSEFSTHDALNWSIEVTLALQTISTDDYVTFRDQYALPQMRALLPQVTDIQQFILFARFANTLSSQPEDTPVETPEINEELPEDTPVETSEIDEELPEDTPVETSEIDEELLDDEIGFFAEIKAMGRRFLPTAESSPWSAEQEASEPWSAEYEAAHTLPQLLLALRRARLFQYFPANRLDIYNNRPPHALLPLNEHPYFIGQEDQEDEIWVPVTRANLNRILFDEGFNPLTPLQVASGVPTDAFMHVGRHVGATPGNVLILLANGALPDITEETRNRPILGALATGNDECLKMLLVAGAKLNVLSGSGEDIVDYNPLMFATNVLRLEEKILPTLTTLIDAGARLTPWMVTYSFPDSFATLPMLGEKILEERYDIASLLLQKGAMTDVPFIELLKIYLHDDEQRYNTYESITLLLPFVDGYVIEKSMQIINEFSLQNPNNQIPLEENVFSLLELAQSVNQIASFMEAFKLLAEKNLEPEIQVIFYERLLWKFYPDKAYEALHNIPMEHAEYQSTVTTMIRTIVKEAIAERIQLFEIQIMKMSSLEAAVVYFEKWEKEHALTQGEPTQAKKILLTRFYPNEIGQALVNVVFGTNSYVQAVNSLYDNKIIWQLYCEASAAASHNIGEKALEALLREPMPACTPSGLLSYKQRLDTLVREEAKRTASSHLSGPSKKRFRL